MQHSQSRGNTACACQVQGPHRPASRLPPRRACCRMPRSVMSSKMALAAAIMPACANAGSSSSWGRRGPPAKGAIAREGAAPELLPSTLESSQGGAYVPACKAVPQHTRLMLSGSQSCSGSGCTTASVTRSAALMVPLRGRQGRGATLSGAQPCINSKRRRSTDVHNYRCL